MFESVKVVEMAEKCYILNERILAVVIKVLFTVFSKQKTK